MGLTLGSSQTLGTAPSGSSVHPAERTYNDLISEDPETVSTVRRIAQRKLEEELEYVETDSVYSYRL